ncbi:MAG: alpha-amylase family glycosyl hydrolase [Flavobacteriaceae bacterium]
MKPLIPLLFAVIILACDSPKPEAARTIAYEPLSENVWTTGVLYEANIRQYSPEGSFNAFAKDLPILKDLGVKILWLMPINPISTTKSKGPLGSYYAVSSYTQVNPEFGTLEDLKQLVRQAHQLGMYVILDWVPGHTGWDHEWIQSNPDFYLKNEAGEIIDPINPFTGESFGWTDVADLNYDNMDMREAMRQAMLYWVQEVDVDGYRIDQAYAVPDEFYQKTFGVLKAIKPVFLLAETDINHPGGIDLISQFDASYDWPGHHLSKDIARGDKNVSDWDTHITGILDQYGLENMVVNFVTNHDENSWNGTINESFGPAAHAFMATHYMSPGMPLIYSGQEYDLNKRLLFFEKDSFPKTSGATMKLLQKLGKLKNNHPALTAGAQGGSYKRIATSKDQQVLAFERAKGEDTLVFIANLHKNYAQFTMPYNGTFKRYQDGKTKRLSSTYQYDMKPWEFWILTK